MNRTRAVKLFLAISAAFISLGIVFVNWFVVDPFNIRALSLPYRLIASLILCGILAGLVYLAFASRDVWLPALKNWRIALGLLIAIALIFLVLPLQPADSRFSLSILKISLNSAPENIAVKRIMVNGKEIDLTSCSKTGPWQVYDGIHVAEAGSDHILSCTMNVPAKSPVVVEFLPTVKTAAAEIKLGNQVQTVDLTSQPGNSQSAARINAPQTLATVLVPLIRLGDAVFILLLLAGLAQIPSLWKDKAASRRVKTFSNAIDSWFVETTPRMQTLALIILASSAILTAFLLLQPKLSGRDSKGIAVNSGKPKPNIIFIVVDALSAKDMSLFGYNLPTTPNLERITKDWTVYSRAQSPQTCTVASLPSFTTGRNPYINDFSIYGDEVAKSSQWTSLPQVLQASGYQTWWMGYNSPGYYHLGAGYGNSACRPGNAVHAGLLSSWFEPKGITKARFPFIPYTLDQLNTVEGDTEDFTQCEEIDSLTSLLENPGLDAPFYIYFHYRGVHGLPYPSGDHLGEFLPLDQGMISFESQHTVYSYYESSKQPEVDQLRLRYDEAVADQDARLGKFLDDLKKQPWYDSSMIIITADHGQSFDNNYTTHCTWLISQAEANVPLLVKYPGQKEGQRVDRVVSTLDVVPTILEAAGFTYRPDLFDGISLLKQPGPADTSRMVFTRRTSFSQGLPSDLAVTDGAYRLVMRKKQLYLYDYNQDPLEKNNLMADPKYANLPEVQRLKQGIDNYLKRAQSLMHGKDFQDQLP